MHIAAQRGLTLVDLTVVLAIVAVLASMALPSYQAQIAKARRADAVAALTRVHAEQERFRAQHGSYALRLAALGSASRNLSDQGHYGISLAAAHADNFIARARAADAGQRDSGCGDLTLSVTDGVAVYGPSLRCWNR